jgi:hypothetical protein
MGTTAATADPPERKPFAAVLQEMRKGGLNSEAADELAALIIACVETQKKGTLTIELSVTPKGEFVEIEDKIKPKVPRHNTPASIFWPDENGNLSTSNPNQLSMNGLRQVAAGRTDDDLRELG